MHLVFFSLLQRCLDLDLLEVLFVLPDAMQRPGELREVAD